MNVINLYGIKGHFEGIVFKWSFKVVKNKTQSTQFREVIVVICMNFEDSRTLIVDSATICPIKLTDKFFDIFVKTMPIS